MSYAKVSEKHSPQGCHILTIRSVHRKEFIENGEVVGTLLVPREDIFLSGPVEKELEINCD